MATAKNVTKEETKAKMVKRGKEYKVIGDRFAGKHDAEEKIKEVSQKGFKSAGLMVQGGEFVVLFGTYDNEQAAKKNAEAIAGAGFAAEIITI